MPPRKKLPKWHKTTPGIYWHGGAAGLEVGDMILPARELAHMPSLYRMANYDVADPSQVYVTT